MAALYQILGLNLADESTRAALSIVAITASITLATMSLARVALFPRRSAIIPNPLQTKIPDLSEKDIAKLEYRPDSYPGARDVSTPDLFGRGFSDGVGDLPHDSRLYSIRLVGYSMGGGIAVHFASAFPHMVESLVLLAPAGLIRAANFGIVSRILFRSGLVPDRLISELARVRLRKPIASSVTKKISPTPSPDSTASPVAAPGASVSADELRRALHHSTSKPGKSMTDVGAAEGADPRLRKRLRHAPLMDQHEAWSKISEREPGSTCILLAKDDEIINPDDYRHDALPLIGGEERVLSDWGRARPADAGIPYSGS
ncbi:unnamed protein product [Parascedosporium putredinis]|uniref:AB hydrolase-1 domain-containing protein n=1 Tax=Parascedosporium putredinis TaxID=1442378 RepID=A0A9P1H623_9PEZI|nr:unnamed protein product [Parascedosporium putredinis]CAI7997620.1 unnamed protein product [Parascedosporium putredinis]